MSILNTLASLEQKAKKLESTPSDLAQWSQETHAFTERFLDYLDEKPAFNSQFDSTGEIQKETFEHPVPFSTIVADLEKDMIPGGLEPASGGHLGYIPGGGILPSAFADYMAAVTNKYAGMFFGSPGAVRMENTLIQTLCNWVGYPSEASGVLLSGGSLSNLTAIVAARDAHSVLRKGTDNCPIYLTAQTHHCMDKALRIAGLEHCPVRQIPMDSAFRMDTRALEKQILADKEKGLHPWLVVANAGSTDTGAIDPLAKINTICKKEKLWFHVDGAYGGLFILLPEFKEKLGAIQDADSVVLDPHKTLFLPYGLGVVLVRNRKDLQSSFGFEASYMQDAQNQGFDLSPAEIGPELTKHFRGLRLWVPLRLFGLSPFRAGLREKVLLTHYFKSEIQEMGYDTPYEPEMTVLLFRKIQETDAKSNAFNKRMLELLHLDGRVFISSTTVDGLFFLRIAILSFRTHRSTVDTLLEMIRGAEKVCG